MNTAAPTISGRAVQGGVLSASTGTWSNSPTSYASQWQDCSSSSGSCAPISGASSSSYTLVASDVGHIVDVVATASNSAGSSSATSSPTGSVVGGVGAVAALFDRVTYSYSSGNTTSQEAGIYQVMVLQSTDHSMVSALHAANPNLKILMYASSFAPATTDPSGLTSCTDYATDNTSHPDWFMKDQSGNRVVEKGYPGSLLMDIGNSAYQQACAAHAASLAKQYGFDGVFLDDFSCCLNFYLNSGVSVPAYSTQSSFQNAEISLSNALGPALHAQGLLAVANIGDSVNTQGYWQRLVTPLDGSMEESWTDGGLGLAQQISDWPAKLANVAWSEANGKIALLHSYNTTEAGNTYGLASMMLLVVNGQSSYSTSNNCYTSCETWYPEYTTVQQLGVPTGPYTQLSGGAYERAFANGLVLVNPTANATGTISLGGTYSGSGLTNVTSVTLPATSGLILLKS